MRIYHQAIYPSLIQAHLLHQRWENSIFYLCWLLWTYASLSYLIYLTFALCYKGGHPRGHTTCFKKGLQVTIVLGAVNVFTDMYLLAILLLNVIRMRISLMAKLGVAAIFSIGIL